MKKHSVLVLSLLTAIVGCGSSDGGNTPVGMAGSGGHAGAIGSSGSGGMSALAGSAGLAITAGSAGSAGSAAAAGGGGSCEIAPLVVFTRSDTDQSWDDNDFSDVTLTTPAACPMLVDVNWPHEAGWENADPADADHESTHFTLDSTTSENLSNKKLSLTIELAADERGAAATSGSYSVSLVSVSTFDRVVISGGAGAGGGAGTDVAGAGGALGGSGGTSGGGGASAGSTAASGGDSSGGTAGAPVTTETGYSEAESPAAERATLRYVGDRATVNFALPNKTAEASSYDPTRVIKINIRIYSAFSNGMTGAGGSAGVGGSGGMAGGGGKAGGGGMSGSGGASGGVGGGALAQVYAYKKSQFKITSFGIKDVGTP